MNHQCILVSRPQGIAQASDFAIVEAVSRPLAEGEIRVRNAWLSVEPAMRGWVGAVANYSEPVAIGAVMRSFAAGRIVESNDAAWPEGTPVTGLFGWQDYAAVDPKTIQRRVSWADFWENFTRDAAKG